MHFSNSSFMAQAHVCISSDKIELNVYLYNCGILDYEKHGGTCSIMIIQGFNFKIHPDWLSEILQCIKTHLTCFIQSRLQVFHDKLQPDESTRSYRDKDLWRHTYYYSRLEPNLVGLSHAESPLSWVKITNPSARLCSHLKACPKA